MCTATSIRRLLGLLALVVLASAPLSAQVPATIDLGRIPDQNPVSAPLTITNPSRAALARVDLISACSCLAAEPARLYLAPGESREVRVTYSPDGVTSSGFLERSLFTRSSLKELDGRRVLVTGTLPQADLASASSGCDECRKLEEQFNEEQFRYVADTAVLVDFYYDPGCGSCQAFLNRELQQTLNGSARQLRLERLSILEPATLIQLTERLSAAGRPLEQFPVAFVGDAPAQGLDAIRVAIRAALRK